MKVDATLLGGGRVLTYENGFFTTENNIVVGKIKNTIYDSLVTESLLTVDKIHHQNRPITDDSIELGDNILHLLTSLIIWI